METGFLGLATRHQPKLAYGTNFTPLNGQSSFTLLSSFGGG